LSGCSDVEFSDNGDSPYVTKLFSRYSLCYDDQAALTVDNCSTFFASIFTKQWEYVESNSNVENHDEQLLVYINGYLLLSNLNGIGGISISIFSNVRKNFVRFRQPSLLMLLSYHCSRYITGVVEKSRRPLFSPKFQTKQEIPISRFISFHEVYCAKDVL